MERTQSLGTELKTDCGPTTNADVQKPQWQVLVTSTS